MRVRVGGSEKLGLIIWVSALHRVQFVEAPEYLPHNASHQRPSSAGSVCMRLLSAPTIAIEISSLYDFVRSLEGKG